MLEMANKLAGENKLSELLKPSINFHIGYVYSMDYENTLILTNDAWKDRAGGIPHNSFLLASALNPDKFADSQEIDREILLLRVLHAAPLPQDMDLIRTRIEHHQRRTSPANEHEDFDPLTAAEMQYGGLNCRILGTFFLEPGSGLLRFGSDIENFMASSKLLVYKPSHISLGIIVNHANPEVLKKTQNELHKAGFKKPLLPLEIGSVRYTSSNRMQHLSNTADVKVKIHPADFLARRTAVLGMTRTGKSNTVKTTIAAVARIATPENPIGQLVFDINGEYANANHQDDGSSIADLFKERCVRYRGLIHAGDDRFKDLRVNFYLQPDDALTLLRELICSSKGTSLAQDLKDFLNSGLEEPDPNDQSQHKRWEVRKAIFQAILYAAKFTAPQGLKIYFPISEKTYNLLELKDNFPKPLNRYLTLSLDQANDIFLRIREKNLQLKKENKVGILSSSGNAWLDADTLAYLNILAKKNSGGTSIKGFSELNAYRDYHSSFRRTDIIAEIINFLKDGKIVILDLSVGSPSIRKTLAERIARQIFERGMADMHNGKTPDNVVLYIEEAHNLIGKDEALDNTWPRIAKEGAKARIALVYATQEPSSIHRNILANTENWFVCHLNNDDELRTLAKFYDFSDFTPSLKKAQDVGFARIKTLSSPFVIPVQINKFDPKELQQQML